MKTSCVIVGRNEDLCVRMLSDHLRSAGARVTHLSENQLEASDVAFSWDVMDEVHGGSDRLTIDGVKLRHSEIDAVLNRSVGIVAPTHLSPEDRAYIAVEWQATILAWTHRIPCLVVNRLRPELWFSPVLGPIELSGLLPKSSFTFPAVTVTAAPPDHELALPEIPLVFTPVSQGCDYPIRDDAARRGLRALAAVLPVCIHSPLPGAILRVVVVGSAVHLMPRELRLDPGPRAALADMCLAGAKSLRLTFCEFAIGRVDGRREWACSMINRLPLLETMDKETQNEVAVSLGSLLLRHDAASAVMGERDFTT